MNHSKMSVKQRLGGILFPTPEYPLNVFEREISTLNAISGVYEIVI